MPAPPTLADHWQRFWYREGNLRPLAVFRVGWSLSALIVAVTDIPRSPQYGDQYFHWPLWRSLSPLRGDLVHFMLALSAFGAALALAGFLARLGVIMVLLGLGGLFASDLLLFRNHVYLLCLLGGLLYFAPSDQVWSVSAAWRSRRTTAEVARHRGSLTAVQMIKMQILIVYGWAVVNKLRGPFLNGWVLGSELADAFPRSVAGSWLSDHRDVTSSIFGDRIAMVGLSWTVLFAEAFIATGLVYSPLRRMAMIAGVMLHMGIALTMNVFAFSLLMIASYPLFESEGSYSEAERSGSADADGNGATRSTSNSRTPDPAPEPP